MAVFKTSPYTEGGLHPPPKNPPEEHPGVPINMEAACQTTAANNPNVHNVEMGSHHEKGAGGSAK